MAHGMPIPPALENRHGRAVSRLLKRYAKPIRVETEIAVSSGGHSIEVTFYEQETEAYIITESSSINLGSEGYWEEHTAVAWLTGEVPIASIEQADGGAAQRVITDADLHRIAELNDDIDYEDIGHFEGETGQLLASWIYYALGPDLEADDAGIVDAGFDSRVQGLTREPNGLVRVEL